MKPSIPPATKGESPLASHSPIPWKVGCGNECFPDGEGGESYGEWLNIIDASGKVICELPGHSQYARGSDLARREDANAELICLAVNQHSALLERVQRLENGLRRIEKMCGEDYDERDPLGGVHAVAREALSP